MVMALVNLHDLPAAACRHSRHVAPKFHRAELTPDVMGTLLK